MKARLESSLQSLQSMLQDYGDLRVTLMEVEEDSQSQKLNTQKQLNTGEPSSQSTMSAKLRAMAVAAESNYFLSDNFYI